MRVTNEMLYAGLNSGISNNQSDVYKLQKQIASGRRLNWASEDPGAFEMIKRLRVDNANVQQYAKNADMVERDLIVLEDSTKSVIDILHRTSEIAISSGGPPLIPEDMANMATEIDMLLENLIEIANTTDAGRYIFAGLRSNEPAYVASDTDADNLIDTVTFQGSSEVRQVEIGRDVYVEANIAGSDSVGSNGIFQTAGGIDLFGNLMDLRDQLLTGVPATGTTILDDINTAVDHTINNLSIIGAREEKVRINKGFLSTREMNLVSAIDKGEAVDIAQAVMELSKKQTAYEASIRAAAGVLGSSSLIHYL